MKLLPTKAITRPRRLLPGLFVVLLLSSLNASFAEDSGTPAVNYWHVWTDDNGVSHQTQEKLTHFEFKSISPPAAPQWQERLKAEGASIVVMVLPVGWVGQWHENPKAQWIIPLSGHWFVETMDGKRVVMGPGDISFGEDQNTKPDAKGHKGHLSGTVGNEPCVTFMVQLNGPSTINQPGHFK
jgi:quercetin dioxygenase-like cupin family protein